MADVRYKCTDNKQLGGKLYLKNHFYYFRSGVTPPSGYFELATVQKPPSPGAKPVEVNQSAVLIGTQKIINLIAGSNVSLTISEDPLNERVDITITAAGGAGIAGGDTGEILIKNSGDDYDYDWNPPSSEPYPEVANYAALPAAADNVGSIYVVLASSGFFLWGQKAGLYLSNGSTWNRLSNSVFRARTDEAGIVDSTDTTKVIGFSASAITTGTTRTLSMADADVDLAEVALNSTHRSGDGSDHSDVAANTTHATGDGSDHADVATNTTHATGDGSDHINVALNDTHRSSDGSDHSLVNSAVQKALFNANTLLKADSDDTPTALPVAEQTLIGRITSGMIAALTATQVRTLLNVENGADVTDSENVNSAGAVMKSDYNAQSVLIAITDNTPQVLTVPEGTIIGRLSGGNITALTKTQVRQLIGIQVGTSFSGTPEEGDKWTDTN